MHMKHFQSLAYIEQSFDEILEDMDSEHRIDILRLRPWGITAENREEMRPLIIEERDAVRYLVSCRFEIADEPNTVKPETHVINRALNRQLDYYERVHKLHAYNVNTHRLKLVRKKYKACRHYLFKFTLPAWVRKMPESLPTFEEKYPDF